MEEYGSIKDFINEVYLLPYLTIGGSRTDFWELTPKTIMVDFKAYQKRMEIQEQQMWLQGLYVKRAIESSIMICGLADKKVIREMPKYPDMPKTQEQIESENYQKARRDLLIAKMNKWQRINNRKK